MKFNYLEIPSSDPTKPPARRPYVVIRLVCGSSFQDLWCLVDSGADVCLFPSSIGRLVGIDVESGRKGEIGGIAEQPIAVYYHSLRLIVKGLSGVDVEAGFTDSKGVRTGILGQKGFFDNYKIVFERYKNTVDIADKP